MKRPVVAAVLVLSLAACSAGAGAPTIGPSSGPSITSPAPPTSAPTASPRPTSRWAADYPHEAPELEANLPAAVDERVLTVWSMVGHTWLEQLMGEEAESFEAVIDSEGLELDDFRYAIAGRSELDHPPFFVNVVHLPEDSDARAAAVMLAGGGSGFLDRDFYRPGLYDARIIGGREVQVGTEPMLQQDDHQRGRPYLYELDELLFIVITDDEDWAADAIRQLP